MNVLYSCNFSEMLSYGCTRLEVGVQSVYEDVARDTNRYSQIGYPYACSLYSVELEVDNSEQF